MRISRDEVRAVINSVVEGCESVAGAIGTDLLRDDEDFIIDGSDLGIAVRELERVSTVLTRLSFRLAE
jgi:hypothetical protein